MLIKTRLNRILAELKEVNILNKRIVKEIKNDETYQAKEHLRIISKLTALEFQELGEILKNLKYEDISLIKLISDLMNRLKKTNLEIKNILNSIDNHSNKEEILLLLKNLGKMETQQIKLEKSFLNIPAVKFEQILEKENIPKISKKKTKERVNDFRKLYSNNEKLSPEEQITQFEKVIDSMGGPEKAMRIYKKIFSFLNVTNKVVRKLFRANKENELMDETGLQLEDSSREEISPEVSKTYTIPYPKEGIPTIRDITILLSLGMFWSMFLATLSGPILVAAFGSWAVVIVIAVGSYLIYKKKIRYITLGKKAMNLLAYSSQGGSIKTLYGKYITPKSGEVTI